MITNRSTNLCRMLPPGRLGSGIFSNSSIIRSNESTLSFSNVPHLVDYTRFEALLIILAIWSFKLPLFTFSVRFK